MILDGKNLGIGKIDIKYYYPTVHGKKVKANIIDIYSEDGSCRFSFYTTIEYIDFNKLELNKKINMITGKYEFVDEDDFYFETKEASYIITSLTANMFITKKSYNEFIIDFETLDLSEDEIIDMNSKDYNYKTLKVNANINFNNIDE